MKQEQARIKVGDFVKVVSGPAYAGPPGLVCTIKGRVEEVEPTADSGVNVVMVRVASGGLWGFSAADLAVVRGK